MTGSKRNKNKNNSVQGRVAVPIFSPIRKTRISLRASDGVKRHAVLVRSQLDYFEFLERVYIRRRARAKHAGKMEFFFGVFFFGCRKTY